MADTGLRQLADRLTERYGTGKTIVDQVGFYYNILPKRNNVGVKIYDCIK